MGEKPLTIVHFVHVSNNLNSHNRNFDLKLPMTKVQERIAQLLNRKTKKTLDDVAS
jgi:hypothetical protein